MRRKKKADLKKLMSISDNIADLNVERFKKFLGSSEVEKMSTAVDLVADVARPAVRVYLRVFTHFLHIVALLSCCSALSDFGRNSKSGHFLPGLSTAQNTPF